ncbi:MAG: hypothetical protein HZB50_15740 [Chloroflexi bacterium]|nr:hypothetical protein [Chloroflexota bacterium]
MLKNLINSGWLYFIVAILFAFAAIGKTISDDSTVIAISWFCAAVFAGLGIWRLMRRNSNNG